MPSSPGTPATSPTQRVNKAAISPRTHLVIAYGVAVMIIPVVALWREDTDLSIMDPGLFSSPILLSVLLWSFHFLRRTAESAWLHRFGRANILLRDAATVYVYYWGFAFWIAHSVSDPDYSLSAMPALLPGLLLFVVGEAGNFYSHLIMRRLRDPGSPDRKIPRGFLFEYISCPHYFFEIITWIGFAAVTGLPGAIFFMAVGAVILTLWARERHEAYRAAFDGQEGREAYPPTRRIIFPYLY